MDSLYTKPCILYELNQTRKNVFGRFSDFQRSVVMIRPMDNTNGVPIDLDDNLEKFKEELFTLFIRSKELRSCECSRLCRAYPNQIRTNDSSGTSEVCPWSINIELPNSTMEVIGIVGPSVQKDILLNYCKIVRTQREWEQHRHEFYEAIKQLEECHAGGNH